MILKKDAFNIYAEMCERQGERAANEDTFKKVLNELASLDIESARTRSLSGGDTREYAWKYVDFAKESKRYMNDREKARYFEEETDDDAEPEQQGPQNARPLKTVAHDPTGYATVTVEVISADEPEGENAPVMKGTVKDRTTAMDFVCWDAAPDLSAGDTLLIENAKVGEYQGNRQLRIEPDVTEVSSLQHGAGYVDFDDAGKNQQLTPTDGGEELEGLKGKIIEHLRLSNDSGDHVSAPGIAGQLDENPEKVTQTLNRIAESMSLVARTGDGKYEVL